MPLKSLCLYLHWFRWRPVQSNTSEGETGVSMFTLGVSSNLTRSVSILILLKQHIFLVREGLSFTGTKQHDIYLLQLPLEKNNPLRGPYFLWSWEAACTVVVLQKCQWKISDLHLHSLSLSLPYTYPPSGWLTFGQCKGRTSLLPPHNITQWWLMLQN